MLDELIKEINELKKYKRNCECHEKDKKRMSDLLYEYMVKEFKKKDYETRVKEHIQEQCKDCMWFYGENRECKWLKGTPNERLPENILEPVKSDKAYIPGRKICEDFRWS